MMFILVARLAVPLLLFNTMCVFPHFMLKNVKISKKTLTSDSASDY